LQGVPTGGDRVINHVRATDVVSATGKHFGEVREYGAPGNTTHMRPAGRANETSQTSAVTYVQR
jgi:hypothetical protein